MRTTPDGQTPNASPRVTRRASYVRRTRTTLLLAVAAVALSAVGGHWCALRAAERRAGEARLRDWAERGAAQLGGTPSIDLQALRGGLESRAGNSARTTGEVYRDWSRALMRDASVAATALVDAQGRVVTFWPPDIHLPEKVAIPRGTDQAYVAAADVGTDLPGVVLAVAPLDRGPQVLPLAYACVYAQLPAGAVWKLRSFLIYAGAVGGIAAAATGFALWRMRRVVFAPLAELVSRVGVNASRDGGDELRGLADNIHALYTELEIVQEHAADLERSIDKAVERRTRRMSGLLRRAEHQAEIDPLTKLANRRFLDARLEPLFQEQKRRGTNLVVIMFDIDNFKPLNDEAGHAAGDAVLRFLGELLRSTVRDGDVGVRYGGDELAVILIDISVDEAQAIAERVTRLFAQRMHAHSTPVPISLSAGLAALAEHNVDSGAALLAKADEALYRAKRNGKNTVETA